MNLSPSLTGNPCWAIFLQKGHDFMDITGLDIIQISQRMVTYAENHFKGFKLAQGDSLFQESTSMNNKIVDEHFKLIKQIQNAYSH